ncbi:MAG: phosphoadenylyl-sulfate reductase [Bacteroidota bacterium]
MKEQIAEWNKIFSDQSPEEILSFAANTIKDRLVFASSLGAEDQVIVSMISQLKLKIHVFTLDTGRLFPETLQLLDRTITSLNIPIQVYFPDQAEVEEMVNKKGINLFYDSVENRKLCCRIRKVNLLTRALKNADAWITGIRSEQSENRSAMEVFEWDEGSKKIKVNPLLNWPLEMVWDYLKKNAVPYNPLHDKGFRSIGCSPCTRAVKTGQDFRAGRWWWEDSSAKECGLHITDSPAD